MTRRLSVCLMVAALIGALPVVATEATSDRVYASKSGVGVLADLGSASAAASTYTVTPVYSSSQISSSYYAQTTPLPQLAESSTMVTYSSSVSGDRYTVAGVDRTGASSSGAVTNFASTTNTSVVTNGYEQPSNYSLNYYVLARGGVSNFTLQPAIVPGGPLPLLDGTPEPGTWVMMATALAGLGVMRRRLTTK